MYCSCRSTVISLLIIICGFLSVTTVSSKKHASTLLFAVVVSRHGMRSPLLHYKNDPYKDERYWPDGEGALTAKGKQEMYQLGQVLRKRYEVMFDGVYRPRDIYIRSTKVTRTYMSCAAMLAGLFPPEGFQVWNPNIDWQPIPIWQDTFDKSDVVMDKSICPAFVREQQLSFTKQDKYLKAQKHIIHYLWKKSGTRVKQLTDFYNIWDPLTCADYQGLKLPKWTKTIYPHKLKPIISNMFKAMTCGFKKQNQLVTGPLLTDINSWFEAKIAGNKTEKMLLHSGHDFTIIGLLCAFGVVDDLVIYPASSLIFELHRTNAGQHYVQMRYYNSNSPKHGAALLHIPECPEPCSLHKFTSLVKAFEPYPDWTTACHK